MKKALAVLTAFFLISAIVTAGCSKNNTDTKTATEIPQQTTEAPTTNPDATVSGGYTVWETNESLLSKDQKKTFEKAMEGFTGTSFQPIAVISQQVVAGVNFVYLCQGTTTTEKPVKSWDIITVYEDLEGNDNILSLNSVDLGNIKVISTKEDEETVSVGAFKDVAVDSGGKIDANIRQAVEKALGKANEKYTLLTVLGSQVNSGTSYLVFAQEEKDGTVVNHILNVTVDADGNAKLTRNEQFDASAYVGEEDADPDGSEY